MTAVPVTSVTLLKGLSNAESARWTEFFRRYEAPMRGFLRDRFPSVDADDVIQETLLALMKALPSYRYTPDRNGHFRNWLMGIVKHKALDALRRETALADAKAGFLADARGGCLADARDARPYRRGETGARGGAAGGGGADEDDWRNAAMEAAVEQVMSDAAISARTREVFRHVALMHEAPDDVARQFGITRNNVDQIKRRLIEKLAALVSAMTTR